MPKLRDLDPLLPEPEREAVQMLFGTVDTVLPFKVIIDGDLNPTPSNRTFVEAQTGDRVVLLLQARVLVAIGVVA